MHSHFMWTYRARERCYHLCAVSFTAEHVIDKRDVHFQLKRTGEADAILQQVCDLLDKLIDSADLRTPLLPKEAKEQ